MKTKNYIYALALATATLALGSCSNEVDFPEAHESSLELEVSDSSRAPIFDSTLPDGSVFAIACVNLTDPSKTELRNVEYNNGQAEIQGAPVKLYNDTLYQVFALYPAPEDLESLRERGMFISIMDIYKDYMVAESEKLRYDNSKARLNFNHILSMLRINVKKSDFVTQDYELTSMGFNKVNIEGWYDFIEQEFKDLTTGGCGMAVHKPLQTDSYISQEQMVLPTESREMDILLQFPGGKMLKHTFVHKPLVAGQILTINVTVSADELKVEDQEIKPWITDEEYEINTAIAAAGKAVDLGVSKLWADRNVGAYSSTEYGEYYFWEQSVSDLWGEDWEKPTVEDFEELMSKCTWKWVKKGTINGYEVSGNGNSIFLPAAGWVEEGKLKDSYNDINLSGLYMSSDPESALSFSSEGSNIKDPIGGLVLRTIRPVKVNK